VSLGSFFGVGAAPGSGTVAVTLNDPVTVLEKQSDDNNKKNIINSNLIRHCPWVTVVVPQPASVTQLVVML